MQYTDRSEKATRADAPPMQAPALPRTGKNIRSQSSHRAQTIQGSSKERRQADTAIHLCYAMLYLLDPPQLSLQKNGGRPYLVRSHCFSRKQKND